MKELKMKALVFTAPGKIELVQKPIPIPSPTEALVRITTTTICGTDVHIVKGEYPVRPGLTIGHEPVGIIEALGAAVTGYTWSTSYYRRDNSLWSMSHLFGRCALPVWWKANGRLEIWKYY